MTKARKLLAVLLAMALVAMVFGLVGCGQKAEPVAEKPATETPAPETPAAPAYKLVTEGKLMIGSDLDYPPMEQLNGDQPEGFDVDLMTAIAKEMGLEIEYLPPQDFDALPALVNAGKFDVIASSLTINDERKKIIQFTDAYFESNQSIAMKAGSTYASPEDLKGKKVGVQSGTTGEQWATENLKPAGATIVPFKKTSQAFAALQGGNVAAVVNDLPITNEIVKDESKKLEIVKQIPTGELYGFAVAKDNPELATAINAALKTVKDSGEYKTMYEKWIGPME
ncbi:MAG TPA: basic amino acid ABC transporter substrate-binding protein [Coriobacteriia bacterium]|nr:basic amino acid ABC transporter substrate-binding protein [Coriobacteriia bacterium]